MLKKKVRLFAQILDEEMAKAGQYDIGGISIETIAEEAPEVYVLDNCEKDTEDEDIADVFYNVLERFEVEAKD